MKQLLCAAATMAFCANPSFAQGERHWCAQGLAEANVCFWGAMMAGQFAKDAVNGELREKYGSASNATSDLDRAIGNTVADMLFGMAPFEYDAPNLPGPDTSIGCLLGDRAYGTCH
ncbi:hypothetical protein JANAI62_37460 [Jannaschia pagri]|uniref:HdeA/HdeB family protein n=1 Tax=Jannaschia pagri TaxID=2829797 RepID=A0ABQ4NRU1_9RHOB|nr:MULTISPECIES: hypothetical protein [unclassified Jannaschia]GIT93347.1 hypothetical protein JANAI61_38050 [Jannaschia sp. AI_61]GIT97123.1 hypothetical protein JANAI62_37460 [Jannaschia sp. AI_62]